MNDDEQFISRWAAAYDIDRGYIIDAQESITIWFATRMRTDRQPPKLVCHTEKNIPNRLDYLDKVFGK